MGLFCGLAVAQFSRPLGVILGVLVCIVEVGVLVASVVPELDWLSGLSGRIVFGSKRDPYNTIPDAGTMGGWGEL